jgi:hypothetical protein
MKKIKELLIEWDNIDFEELGVDIMSLVDRPAIQTTWLAFAEEHFVEPTAGESEDEFIGRCIPVLMDEGYEQDQATAICYATWEESSYEEFASYNDYPEAAKNNAQRALDWAEEHGWGSCGTAVGKARANQLAKGENISEDTIARMASFKRHEQHKDVPYSEGCGGLMWDAWGGSEGIKWASNKLQQIREEKILELSQEYGEEVDYRDIVEIDMSQSEFSTIGDYLKGVTALDILGKRVKKDEPAVTKYRYAGPPAERNYCKAMLRMQKLYTKQEIAEMSRRVDTGFRHNGQSYSIFDFKGGVNCKHYWEELLVFKGSNDKTIMISKGPASGNAGQIASRSNNYWRFASEEEQIVIGPAMIPNKLILRKDELGNPYHVYFSKETIKKIAKKFLEQSNHNNTDINHNDEVVTQNTLLESWIVEDPEKDKSAVYGFGVPEGTWMVSYKINDTNTWNKIKSGELNGFSVTGNFIEKLQ